MLKINHVSKTFNIGTINEKKALMGVSLHLNKGDFVTIIGGNGAGKSTLMNAITGVWPVDNGSIYLDGVNITGLKEHKRAKYIGRVFQDPMMGTAPDMQIVENLALAYRRGKSRTLRWGTTSAEKAMFREKLSTLGLGLEDRMTTKVGLLSGGQRQALTLLMASLRTPKLLLLDEPTKGMDALFKRELGEKIRSLVKGGMTVVAVSHDSEFCAEYCDECAFICDGICSKPCPSGDFFSDNFFYTTEANKISRHIFENAVTETEVLALCRKNQNGR